MIGLGPGRHDFDRRAGNRVMKYGDFKFEARCIVDGMFHGGSPIPLFSGVRRLRGREPGDALAAFVSRPASCALNRRRHPETPEAKNPFRLAR